MLDGQGLTLDLEVAVHLIPACSPSSAPACTSDQCRSRSIGLLEEQLSGRQSRLAGSPWQVPPRFKRKTEEVTSHKEPRKGTG
ncbi:hypothetical protein ATANTOWER_028126 [Ataeniobius toweri]|uniref:Uncharacterized protein n=1 Tax=Ataeniobius toweri TaxID=208326 RepID=A0ABU7B324_9TELE|nr:hypothetical protein [Ataeniobius toweri]